MPEYRFYTEIRCNETGGHEFIEIIPSEGLVRYMSHEELKNVVVQTAYSLRLNVDVVEDIISAWLDKNDFQQMIGICVTPAKKEEP